MPATYDVISSQTVSSPVNTVTIGSIPSTYTDLRLTITGRCSADGRDVQMRFNGDSGSNYVWGGMDGSNINTSGATTSMRVSAPFTYTWINFTGFWMADIMDYTANRYKTVLVRSTSLNDPVTGWANSIGTNLWAINDTITSISVFPQTLNWAAGTVITLHGIKRF